MRIHEIINESDFEIKSLPKAFHITSSGAYGNKIRSVIKTLSTNNLSDGGGTQHSAEERVMELAKEAGVDIRQPQIQRFAQLMIRELQFHRAKE